MVARRLAASPDLVFTADTTSAHERTWEACLSAFAGRPGVRMLEIGSFEGRSAIWFLQHVLTHPSSTLTCVDEWWSQAARVRFDHNLRVVGVAARVRALAVRSLDGLPSLRGERFDVVYVDGCHAAPAVLMDAVLAWDLLLPDGVLIFDDYRWRPDLPPGERPEMAIDAFLRLIDGRYDLLHHSHQVIIRKPAALP
jgi:predicted O-methyltransferase YrrM